MGAPDRLVAAGWLACAFVVSTATASPASAEDFFKGKSIAIYIGSGPAGSYDNFGRLAARHLGRFVPGEPVVVPQNMPGAGSLQVANFIYNVAPKDGTALGLMSPSTTVMQTFPGARYDAARLRWIGRITTNTNVTYTLGAKGIGKLEDAQRSELRVGATAPSSPLSFQTRIVNHIAGTKFRLILGYPDAAASLLAMERGEVDAVTTAWNTLKTARPEWLKSGQAKILLQYGLRRNPELADVPVALELGRTESDVHLLSLFMNAAEVGYALMTASEVSEERVRVLQEAFERMTADADYMRDAVRIETMLEPMNGRELEKLIRTTSRVSPAMREKALHALAAD